MKSPRITPQELGLIKGAMRRVFSRSLLREKIVKSASIEHRDPRRPRVKRWSVCTFCTKKVPSYLCEVDHITPVCPLDKGLVDMNLDDLADNIWCEESNLQLLCKECHLTKTKEEGSVRRRLRSVTKKKRRTLGRQSNCFGRKNFKLSLPTG